MWKVKQTYAQKRKEQIADVEMWGRLICILVQNCLHNIVKFI